MSDSVWSAARYFGCVLACVLATGCGLINELNEAGNDPYRNIVVDIDRSDADRVIDQRRDPQKLLRFYAVKPGMQVFDMSTGRGYNTELLARVVGANGRVYAQNSPQLMSPATKTAIEERLKSPVMQNVVFVVREF